MLAADFRIQLHRTANRGLTIRLHDELIEGMGMGTMTRRFEWKNVYGEQIGAQYRVTDDVVVRLGASTANSATPRSTVTQFGVPLARAHVHDRSSLAWARGQDRSSQKNDL